MPDGVEAGELIIARPRYALDGIGDAHPKNSLTAGPLRPPLP
jgi:hypothetical protein